jgi:integrase
MPVLATSIFTGLRQSECLGLRWADVDFAGGRIHVRGQLSNGRAFVEMGKTAAARREVVLMPGLARLLRQHRAASRFSQEHDYLFAATTGGPPSHRNVAGFETARDRAGLDGNDGRPRFRWHDMRHTFASILIAEGRDVNYVAAQLGHSKPSITLDVYGHLSIGSATPRRRGRRWRPATEASWKRWRSQTSPHRSPSRTETSSRCRLGHRREAAGTPCVLLPS